MFAFLSIAASLSLLAWLYLILFRGRFWTADQEIDPDTEDLAHWPSVVALVPARDEADTIGQTLDSLLMQDYPGELHVVLIDDHSADGTAERAAAIAQDCGQADRLAVIQAGELPEGWSGKLWALNEGWTEARRRWPDTRYFWLSDADIAHWLQNLRLLVAKAHREHLDLVSVMATLSCHSFWERIPIPPFVYFFQKLYPFRWVNDPNKAMAAAAGGCVLVNAKTLEEAGGFDAIKGEIIDDCALAARIKEVARRHRRGIWLGLGEEVTSVRPYDDLDSIWHMVTRTAYTQLNHSPLYLAATVLGMILIYLIPPFAALFGALGGLFADIENLGAATMIMLTGSATWGLMMMAAAPTLRLYRQPLWVGLLMPLSAMLYTAMTVDSARRYMAGEGGLWKGRVQAAKKPS